MWGCSAHAFQKLSCVDLWLIERQRESVLELHDHYGTATGALEIPCLGRTVHTITAKLLETTFALSRSLPFTHTNSKQSSFHC
jgi:hypothetical protein